jgi:hypothetical protein
VIDCTESSGDAEDTNLRLTLCSRLGLPGVTASKALLVGGTPYAFAHRAGAAVQVDTLALRCGGWWNHDVLRGARGTMTIRQICLSASNHPATQIGCATKRALATCMA